jgi:hypothetical protein
MINKGVRSMTAKEMFEELGYEQKVVIDKYNHQIIAYESFFDSYRVEFDTHYKSCYLVCTKTGYYEDEFYIPVGKFILAITQQMKELWWL